MEGEKKKGKKVERDAGPHLDSELSGRWSSGRREMRHLRHLKLSCTNSQKNVQAGAAQKGPCGKGSGCQHPSALTGAAAGSSISLFHSRARFHAASRRRTVGMGLRLREGQRGWCVPGVTVEEGKGMRSIETLGSICRTTGWHLCSSAARYLS